MNRAQSLADNARERLLDAAYHLFSQQGIGAVGVDTIIAQSGVAKMSLYRHFQSKEGLVLAFLDRREKRWTLGWLETEVLRRAQAPEARLLAFFDVFDGWFKQPDFEGCSFVNVLLEAKAGSATRQAAAEALMRIRAILKRLASEAGLAEPESFAQTWQMLMKGCIISAQAGSLQAAHIAQRAAATILENWPRKAAA